MHVPHNNAVLPCQDTFKTGSAPQLPLVRMVLLRLVSGKPGATSYECHVRSRPHNLFGGEGEKKRPQHHTIRGSMMAFSRLETTTTGIQHFSSQKAVSTPRALTHSERRPWFGKLSLAVGPPAQRCLPRILRGPDIR